MKSRVVIMCFAFILVFMAACGKQEDSVTEKETDDVQEETVDTDLKVSQELKEEEKILEKEQESVSEPESTPIAETVKSIMVSETDFDYVLSDVTASHKQSDGTEEFSVNNIFGFNLPSGSFHLYGFNGFSSNNPYGSRKNYETSGAGLAETEIDNSQLDCFQSYSFVNGDIDGAFDNQQYPVLHIALARDKETRAGMNQVSNIGYLKAFLRGGNPKEANLETYDEYELGVLEKEDVLDSAYGEVQVIYQVTSHNMNGSTCYDSEREVVILPITEFNEFVYFDEASEQNQQVWPVNEYDILIEYIYPKTDNANGYQHILADMLPDILNKK